MLWHHFILTGDLLFFFSFILLHNIADSVTFILAYVQWGKHSICLMRSYSNKRHRLHVLVCLSELTYHIVLPAYISLLGAFSICDPCLPFNLSKRICLIEFIETDMPHWIYSDMIQLIMTRQLLLGMEQIVSKCFQIF